MSLATKDLFKKCVSAQQAAHLSQLALRPPVFEDDCFLTIAVMNGRGGKVELWCGPAEYHVEIFIYEDKRAQRLSLRDLLMFAPVADWMRTNKASLGGKQRVEAEVEYAFRLLVEAIARLPKMGWLLLKSPH
jgi:hypothetical protein